MTAAWAALAILNYASFHPIDPAGLVHVILAPLPAASLSGAVMAAAVALKALGVFVLTVLAALAPGFAVLDLLRSGPAPRGERLFFALLLGLGSLGFIVAGAGLCGFYSAGSYAAILVPCACLGLSRIRGHIAGRPPGLPGTAAEPYRPNSAFALALIPAFLIAVAVVAGTLVSGFAPPHMSDELVCHLGNARWFLWHHKITPQPGNPFSAWSPLASMLYGAPEAAGLVFGTKWTHWLAGLLAAYGVHILARDARPAARTAVVLAFLTMPAVWTFAGRAYTELFICALAAGALISSQRAGKAGNGVPFAILAGACVGLAGGYKHLGLLLGLLILPLLPLRLVPAAAGAALAVSAPWLARNILETGNPVFPLFHSLLDGLGWDDGLALRYRRELFQGEPAIMNILSRLPALPWSIPVHNPGSGPDGTTGIMILLALPLLVRATAREALALALFILPNVLASGAFRFLIPAVPLMLAVIARSLSAVPDGKHIRGIFPVVLVLLTGHQAAQYFQAAWQGYDNPLPVALGTETPGRYLDRTLYPARYYPPGYSSALKAAGRLTPSGARVLFLGGYGGVFHLAREALFHPLQGRPLPVSWAGESANASGIARRFRQAGITHVLVNRWWCESFHDYWRIWDWPSAESRRPGLVSPSLRWKEFWDTRAIPVWSAGGDRFPPKVKTGGLGATVDGFGAGDRFALYAISDRPVRHPRRTTPGLESEIIRLAMSLVRQRRLDPANAILDQARGRFDDNPLRWLAESEYLLARGRSSEAERCCVKIAGLAPGSVILLRCRAGLLTRRNRLKGAVALLKEAAWRDPDEPQIWVNLAAACYGLNDPGMAATAEREVHRIEGELSDR